METPRGLDRVELRKLREELGVSQADLADVTGGYSENFVTDLESGRLPILADIEARLLQALGRCMLAQLRRGDYERQGA